MKKPAWIEEFGKFIARGNVLDMAVGVVIGGAFTAIVTSIVENILTPLIALPAKLGAEAGMEVPDFASWSFMGFGYGAVINAIISFLITAFAVFWLVKTVNKAMELTKKKEEEAPAPEEPAGPTQEELLMEIRDLLKAQQEK